MKLSGCYYYVKKKMFSFKAVSSIIIVIEQHLIITEKPDQRF